MARDPWTPRRRSVQRDSLHGALRAARRAAHADHRGGDARRPGRGAGAPGIGRAGEGGGRGLAVVGGPSSWQGSFTLGGSDRLAVLYRIPQCQRALHTASMSAHLWLLSYLSSSLIRQEVALRPIGLATGSRANQAAASTRMPWGR